MSTTRLETFIPDAGVDKPKSRIGLIWDKLTKPAEEPPYRPLPEHFIRVAKIKPGTKGRPLRVKLRHIDPRVTKYIALSYTWDKGPTQIHDPDSASSTDSQATLPGAESFNKPQTTTLLCGGTSFRVRQNLYDALCQIRDVQCDVPVFVDALCINFNDNTERANHLEIVGQVYSRAASVIVYLGPKSSGTDSTVRIMRQLVNAVNWRLIGNPFADNERCTNPYNFRDPYFFESLGMEPITLKQWRAIRDFCHMRWFTRYWAFFELALAKNALFLWGEACMEYDFLIDFCMILAFSGWLDELDQISAEEAPFPRRHPDSNAGLIKMLTAVARLRSNPQWSPNNPHFASWMRQNHGLIAEQGQAWKFFEILLQFAEPFDCFNPLDKVYAPLAFVRASFAGKPLNKTWPRPNYQKAVEQAYNDFAEHILRETGIQSIIIGMNGHVDRPQSSSHRRNVSVIGDIANLSHIGNRNEPQSRGRTQHVVRSRPEATSRHESRPKLAAHPVMQTSSRSVNAYSIQSRALSHVRTDGSISHRSDGNADNSRASSRNGRTTPVSREGRPQSRNGKLVKARTGSRTIT